MTDQSKTEYELPEAGGIAFTTIYSKTGLPINLTCRAQNPIFALTGLVESIKFAIDELKFTTEKPMPPAASAPKAQATTEKIAELNPALAEQMDAANAEVPPSRKGANVAYEICDTDIIEIAPQLDNRVTIHFFGVSDKYPRVSINKWKIESALGLMRHVTSDDLSKPAKLSLPVRVYYTNGKETAPNSGKYYKDVEHVRPR